MTTVDLQDSFLAEEDHLNKDEYIVYSYPPSLRSLCLEILRLDGVSTLNAFSSGLVKNNLAGFNQTKNPVCIYLHVDLTKDGIKVLTKALDESWFLNLSNFCETTNGAFFKLTGPIIAEYEIDASAENLVKNIRHWKNVFLENKIVETS